MASIKTLAIIGVFQLTQSLFSFEEDRFKQTLVPSILNQIETKNEVFLIKSFDVLQENLRIADSPLEESYQFLTTFIESLNHKYNLKISFEEACLLVKHNIHTLHLSETIQTILLNTIDLLLTSAPNTRYENNEETIYLPTAHIDLSKLFTKKDKHKKKSHHSTSHNSQFIVPPLLQIIPSAAPQKEKELPSSIYVGGVELFAAGLLFILTPVYPPVGYVAWGLVGDGSRRLVDGFIQMGEERRNDPNFIPPSGPFDIKF